MKPLEGLVVLEFSQFLSGPSAALRLADLGARVIKIERIGTGDAGRHLSLNNLKKDNDSVVFHVINRNKESYAVDLKNPEDLQKVKKLIKSADVLIQSFRPGIMEKFGLDYETVKGINKKIVYGSVSGYGNEGPLKDKPGQDLLAQSMSGLPWLNGDSSQPPLPFGLAVADLFSGAHLVQGILACLVRRGKTNEGGLVEVSLFESVLDFQFEVFTTYLNDGQQLPVRSEVNSAHAYLSAPYGVYETKDGYLSLAMGSIVTLAELIDCPELLNYSDPDTWFTQRDEIKSILVNHLKTRKTSEWLAILEPADVWCSDVFTWDKLIEHEGFKVLDMIQETKRSNGVTLKTTRCPININKERIKSDKGSPILGENNLSIEKEFSLLT